MKTPNWYKHCKAPGSSYEVLSHNYKRDYLVIFFNSGTHGNLPRFKPLILKVLSGCIFTSGWSSNSLVPPLNKVEFRSSGWYIIEEMIGGSGIFSAKFNHVHKNNEGRLFFVLYIISIVRLTGLYKISQVTDFASLPYHLIVSSINIFCTF